MLNLAAEHKPHISHNYISKHTDRQTNKPEGNAHKETRGQHLQN